MSEHILANTDFHQVEPLSKQALGLSALSFCLGTSQDTALLNFIPSKEYLAHIHALNLPTQAYCLLDKIPPQALINPWRLNPALEAFAQKSQATLKYSYHPLHETLDSKAYSFSLFKPPFESFLIHTKEELLQALKEKTGRYVLKVDQGQSGKGHFFLEAPTIYSHLIDYKNVRLEKWVERVFDFSSQWLFNETLQCLGICELINNPKGGYLSSRFPLLSSPYELFIQEHLRLVKPHLLALHKKGFRGHLGIDAFIYVDNNELTLCPLIEINPRKTMGFVCLHLATHFNKPCHLMLADYDPHRSILPPQIEKDNRCYRFKKNLNLSFF